MRPPDCDDPSGASRTDPDPGHRPEHRTACVEVPAFPLQILLRRHPDWRHSPAAVVADDRPQGRVLWVNEESRRMRVLPGMRYAGALAAAPGLRAARVPPEEIDRGVAALAERLRSYSPFVEASQEEPGVCWLDASGLSSLYPDLSRWCAEILGALAQDGLEASVVVGFTRFGAYAAARALSQVRPQPPPNGSRSAARPRILVFATPVREAAALRRVPLDRLGLPPDARDLLARLGVRAVGDLAHLPPKGIEERFGKEAARLARLAHAAAETATPSPIPSSPTPSTPSAHAVPSALRNLDTPISRAIPPDPLVAAVALEFPESDATRLLFVVTRLLAHLLPQAAARREAVSGLRLAIRLERGRTRDPAPAGHETPSPEAPGLPGDVEILRPAAPTLEQSQLLDLVRLRLNSLRLPSGATDLALLLDTTRADPEQLRLFAQRPRRDPAAADRALARLRAEFGDDAVVRAVLRDGHLPEATFAWEPLTKTAAPRPRSSARPVLVRRIRERPAPLPPRPRHEEGGWLLRGLEFGPVVKFHGPYVVAGGWWAAEHPGGEVRREYHFAETSRGHLSWVFYDVRRRRWFLQGEVS